MPCPAGVEKKRKHSQVESCKDFFRHVWNGKSLQDVNGTPITYATLLLFLLLVCFFVDNFNLTINH